MSWTTVDYDVAMEVACHEAIVRQAYKNAGDVWTWSVGLTSATGHNVERYIGKPQSLEHCLRVYAWALDNYADAVRRTFAGYELTKEQFTAALSFHWNTGGITKASWVKHWKNGKIAAAKKAFMAWNKPSYVIGRREDECDLFFDGKWSNNGTMPEYTRVKNTGSIDWSSRRNLDVSQELRAALAGEIPASDKVIVPVPVPKPIAPKQIDKPVTKTTGFWERITSLFGVGAAGVMSTVFNNWMATVAILGAVAVLLVIGLLLHKRIVDAVKYAKEELEE